MLILMPYRLRSTLTMPYRLRSTLTKTEHYPDRGVQKEDLNLDYIEI